MARTPSRKSTSRKSSDKESAAPLRRPAVRSNTADPVSVQATGQEASGSPPAVPSLEAQPLLGSPNLQPRSSVVLRSPNVKPRATKAPLQFFSPRKSAPSNASTAAGTTYVDTIFVESAGLRGEFLVMTAERQNGDAAWTNDLYNPYPEVLRDSGTWDVRVQGFLHLRESRENNVAVPCATSGRSAAYNRFGLLSFPEKKNLCAKNALRQPDKPRDTLFFEELFRDEIEVLLRDSNRSRAQTNVAKGMNLRTVYAPWDALRHSKTPKAPDGGHCFRPLDHIFVDAAVGKIINAYFGDHTTLADPSLFYQKLLDQDMADAFFSRGSNGKYSVTAQTSFGYPVDTVNVETTNAASSGSSSDPVDDKNNDTDNAPDDPVITYGSAEPSPL